MLRITQSTGVDRAKSYYSTADYYLDGEQELPGRWRGKGARRLGLAGEVDRFDWEALCENRDPRTGRQLTLRQNADRTVGYDFNFHVPKSLSLLYGMSRDERLLDAFRDAVDGTMHDMEAEMQTRVRKQGKNENKRTGNMTWGEFIHFTSRPVDGVPDPHLHAHCFVFNVTHDKEEQAWKAGQFRGLKQDAPYFEAVFHSRLASRLSDLGLPVTRSKHGWELAEVTPELVQKFSRRTALIEEQAQKLGIDNPETKSHLGARTRERKQQNLTLGDLQGTWRERMTDQEWNSLDALEKRIGTAAEPQDGNAAVRAVEHALSHEFERKSVVPERKVLATALTHSVGQATVEQVLDRAKRSELIVGERQGRRMASTLDVLAEEKQVIEFARRGRGTCAPFVRKLETFKREWLNADQQRAVRHVVESRDRVMVIRGAAGVGKTTLLKEAVETIEGAGTKVYAFAPSADASRGVLRSEGFDAETVARLLVDEQLQSKVAGQMILIDEAGLLGMKTMRQVFQLAEKLDSRVLLSGDWRQHGSVERGAALRVLEEEAGLVPAEVKEIQRQCGSYKAAVKALSEGNAAVGLDRLDDLGWVHEIADDQRDRQLAVDYVASVLKGKTALVVSPTHAEGDRITSEIRRSLKAEGTIGTDERTFEVLQNSYLTEAERGDGVNYRAGDVLQFHQNAKGFRRGERVTADDIENLPFDQANRFQVFQARTLALAQGDKIRITHNGQTADGKHKLNNGAVYEVRGFDDQGNILLNNGWTVGKNFGHFTHGYVVTSHSSQGKTVDRVFVGQSSQSFPASSREQFYVSASRARERVTIYTDDKQALRDAINHGDERLSATEFVNGAVQRQSTMLREREHENIHESQPREREEMQYVR
ncbi:Multifunctional conjugation protein TraI [Symmachiella dynata]|uniref:Multifunctional conjugation protein TraI n=1 Tax=Symmachiella dynata TaxID=2527995 RepID=A0A517ZS07_9PLAN|nr:MobF family relaxase [Symmachiella dynata]QDU45223.1 Multifunctional conjugation protein TraI [Symmachiella dynata]